MFLPHSKKTINKTIDDEKFAQFTKKADCQFFNMDCGIEHYRLLTYLSHSFNDCHIFDIGTALGLSALALSYNDTNTIYSFDIKNCNVSDEIVSHKNIKFILDDLWSKEGRERWEDVLLSSKFIFLDIDPHEGLNEYEFYQYLKVKNYQGFIVFDDIHHFQGMRDNFWSKIPDYEKVDITDVGHWSGTGVISFQKKYIEIFETMDEEGESK